MKPQQAQQILSTIFSEDSPVPCKITLWGGQAIHFGTGEPKFNLCITDPETFESMLTQPSMTFGEAYVNGKIKVEGNLADVLEWIYQNQAEEKLNAAQKARICWLHLKKKAGIRQARRDVQYHYDRGNSFYRLWLDRGMNYSCAFFSREDEDLETAQINKIHRSLRKLRLKPGQRLLDIGCGWASVIIEAARTYGVKAVGLTLSKKQYELGRKRIQEAGLSDMAEVRLQDYREMAREECGRFDRIISIGMFEHVGRENIPVFFKKASELIREKGILLLHTIGRPRYEEMDPWITKHIFPGTYLPSVGEILEEAQLRRFDFADLENLRQHYDRTLGIWAERFEKNLERIRELTDEKFIRMWRFYLYGCQMAFRHGNMHVFQLLFSAGRRNDWPLVREELQG